MIAIEINNSFLNLGDANIRIEKNNPSFITELFQGDYSFPFTIPTTENNLRILGFVNTIEIVNRTIELEGYLWLFGAPYLKTKILVSAGTHKSITLNLASGLKAMRIADKSLKDINFGSDYVLGSNTDEVISKAKDISLITDYTTYGFTFVPHKNLDFYGGANPDFCGIVNRQNSVTGDFFKNDAFIGNKYCLVPFLYLFFILKKIFEAEGLTPTGDFWNDPEMQKLLIYNNYALDSPNEDDNCYVLAGSDRTYNTNTRLKLFKGPTGSFDAAGAWSNTLFEYTILQAGDLVIDVLINAYSDTRDTMYFGTYEPHFNLYIDGVLAGALTFPSQSYGNFSRSLSYAYTATVGDIGKKIHLENIVAPIFLPLTGLIFNVKASSYLLITNNSDAINIYKKSITFSNHVADISVSDFLSQFKNIGISFEFNYNNLTVAINYDKNYMQTNDIVDWTGKATTEYELNFEDRNKGYKVNYDFGASDKLVEGNFKKYLAKNFKGEYSTLKNLPHPSNVGFIALVTNSNQLYITAQNPLAVGLIWQYFGDNYYDIVIGRGEQESKTKIAPMFMDFTDNEGGTSLQNRCLIPTSSQQGSSQMFSIGVSDFDIRFVFLRGVNQSNGLASPEGGNYIYAGTTRFGINGDIVGSYEFSLNSKYGLIDKFVLDFLRFLNNADIVDVNLRLHEVDIVNLNIKKKTNIDGVGFLIKSISLSMAKTLSLARAKMLKL